MSQKMILQIEPWIDNQELIQLKRVVDSTFVTEGELTREFEILTKELTGSKHVIAMSNGTVALYCILKSLNIGPGDEVIVPDLTFIASANAVIMAGATPVFCDINKDSFCIDINSASKRLTKNTRAILPVHLYGNSAEMDIVLDFANKNGLRVIEDAAQGVGVKYKGKHVGTFGDAGILSYYGNKTITCGEGGVVLTENDEIAQACYRLKNHGRDRKGIFYHEHIGFNFSFTEMQAAIGIAQMHKLPAIIKKKKKIHDLYLKTLSEIRDFEPAFIPEYVQPVYWFTSFITSRVDDLAEYLMKNNIQTRRFFYPLHLQPCYSNYGYIPKVHNYSDLVNSVEVYKTGISLPSSYNLSTEDQMYVISKIKDFFNHN